MSIVSNVPAMIVAMNKYMYIAFILSVNDFLGNDSKNKVAESRGIKNSYVLCIYYYVVFQ